MIRALAWVFALSAALPAALSAFAQTSLNMDTPLGATTQSPFLRTLDPMLEREETDWSVGLGLQYANQPLVLLLDEDGNGSLERRTPIIEDWAQARLNFEYMPAKRILLTLRSPAFAYSLVAGQWDGTGFRRVFEKRNGLSDARLEVAGEFLRVDSLSLGGRMGVAYPTGSGRVFARHAAPTLYPEVAIRSTISKLTAAFNLGASLTDASQRQGFRLEQGLSWRLGGVWAFHEAAGAGLELSGGTELTQPYQNVRYSPTELSAHGDLGLGSAKGFRVKPFVGIGLVPGIGAARYRGGASIRYSQPWTPPPPPPEVIPDTDGDGLDDEADACPEEAETVNGHEDEDGCPEADTDADGIIDALDKCAADAEDIDRFEDEDGCPDPDNDQDGIPDTEDQCAKRPEDIDGWKDEDGCPDKDNDGDGLKDDVDQCPDEAEVINGVDDEDGCPDKGGQELVEVTTEEIKLRQKIFFASESDDIRTRSYPLLNQVAAVLRNYSSMLKVRIEGHTDRTGSATFNRRLSERRARSVRRFLVRKGIDADRLDAMGFGGSRPRATNRNPRGRGQNRRVEFIVVERVEELTDAQEEAEEQRQAEEAPAEATIPGTEDVDTDTDTDTDELEDSERSEEDGERSDIPEGADSEESPADPPEPE